MTAVAQQVDVECGTPERHTVACSKLWLDGALRAYTDRKWTTWVRLRAKISSRRGCGCYAADYLSDAACSFAGPVDALVDEGEGMVVWTCPRCFTDHFDEV